MKHHKHKELGSKRSVRASCHRHRGHKQALSRVQTTSYSRDGHLGPRREQGAEMCQLSKMLTQHKPSLSWCSLLANSLQMLQEKSSLNCASCCLPRLSWRTSQTAWHVPHYILSAPSCRSSMWSSVFSRARFKLHHLKDLTHVVTIWHNLQWDLAAQCRRHSEQFSST